MQTRYWPYMAGLVLCLTAALGCVTYMFSGGESPLMAFALCALALMCGQLLLGVYASRQAKLSETTDRHLASKIGKASSSQEAAQRQAEFALAELQVVKAQVLERGIAMTQSLDELKSSYDSLARSLSENALIADPYPKEAETDVVQQQMQPEPAPTPVHQRDRQAQRLSLSLEPIVDLVTGRTAHYRVHFAAAAEMGRSPAMPYRIPALDQAELDLSAVTEALGLLQHLRRRDPQIKLFMTLSVESLTSSAAILNLLEILQAWPEPDESASIVFELPHASLAGLSATALEGLGYLARAGQPLALTNISVVGLEPASLQALNMHHVSLDANAIDLRFGMPATYQHFAQLARIANVQIMLANVTDASSLPQLRRISRLGSGPVFAAPRRVRKGLAPTSVELAA